MGHLHGKHARAVADNVSRGRKSSVSRPLACAVTELSRADSACRTARLLNDMIKETYAPHLASVVFEGEAVAPPTQIPWYALT